MPTAYESQVLALAPSAFWPMHDAPGTTLSDISGGAHTLTLPSSAGVENWAIDAPQGFGTTAVDFTGGANSVGVLGSTTELAFGSGTSFTLEVWAGSNANPAAETGLITKGYANTGQDAKPWYLLRWQPTGVLSFYLRTAGSVDTIVSTYGNWSDYNYLARGPWHHIVCRYDASTGKASIWLDGVRHAEASAPAAAYGTNTGVYTINKFNGNALSGPVMGMMAVYSFALSDAQIKANFQTGLGTSTYYPYQTAQQVADLETRIDTKLDAILAAVKRSY